MSLLTGYDKSQVGSEIVALHGNAPHLFSNAFSEADKVKSPEPISRGDARSSSAGAPWGMTGEIRKRQNTAFLIVSYSVSFRSALPKQQFLTYGPSSGEVAMAT